MILLLPISLTSPLALPLATVLTRIDLSDLFKICQTCSHLDIFTFASFCLEWPLPRYLHVSLLNLFQESAQTSPLSYVFPDHPFMLSAILCSCALLSPIALKLRITYYTSLPHTLEWKLLEGLYFCLICLPSF